MAEESNGSKWEGKSIVELQSTSANQAWPLLEDFFNIHNLIPIDTCYQVESVEGHPGPTRYCASAPKGAHGGADDHVLWVKERLLSVDQGQRCLSYDVVDGNLGFNNYVGTIKVVPSPSSLEGCKIEWSFVTDPLETWSFKDLTSYIDSSLQFMAKKIELACSKASV